MFQGQHFPIDPLQFEGGPRSPYRRSAKKIIDDLGFSTGLRLCLDAGVSDSYSSGQKWLDLSGGGYDFFRGADNTATTDDPTYNGTPGGRSSAEYFSFDGGDYLTYDAANETWMNNLHKNNAKSAAFGWLYMTSAGGNKTIFGTNGGLFGVNIGVHFLIGASQNLVIRVNNTSGANSWSIDWAGAGIPTDTWVFVAYNHDEAGGAGQSFVYFDGTTSTADGAVPVPSAANATYVFQIGARGNNNAPAVSGTRIAMLCVWEGANLSIANFDALRAATRPRFLV